MIKRKVCEWCGKEFQPTAYYQKYCLDCRTCHAKEIDRERDRARKRRRRLLKVQALPKQTISDVIRELMAYNEKHDRHLSYGQYVGLKHAGALKD